MLDAFFAPRSIAVVGASRDPAKLGHVLLKNVLDYGFAGDVFPVNPSGGEILGRRVYASLRDVPSPDLVLLSIPNRAVPSAIADAASRGARGAVILSSGFGEMGGEGADLQRSLRGTNLRVIGPNCMGVYHLPSHLNATYFWELPRREGGLAFVSQSGAYGGMLFSELRRRAMGISTFVSIGNQADVTHAEVMEALVDDARAEVVGLFIEQIHDGARFLAACRALASRKRVIAMKVGRTAAGARAAQSHTGSLAGDFEVCRAALTHAGAYVARETSDFFDALAAACAHPRPLVGGLGIVTISGGPCVAAADACEESGVAVPELAPETQQKIRALTPEFAAPKNPVDMTPQMDPAKMPDCVAAIEADPAVGALLAINVGLDKPEFAEAFVRSKKPVFAFVVDAPVITKRLTEAGIPVFDSPERAARAIASLTKATAKPHAAPATQKAGARSGADQAKARKILEDAGIPLCREILVDSLPAALRAAKKLKYPVVLKATCAHKSDVKGVALNLQDAKAVTKAYRDLAKRLGPEVLVQEMVQGDHEVLIGARRDPTFGPVLLFGSGGIWTEHLRDVSFRVAPVSPADARAMIAETRAGARLAGLRGTSPGDIAALVSVLVSLSKLMLKSKDILDVDLNPVLTGPRRTVAVDALAITRISD